jgi:hypothetical protein
MRRSTHCIQEDILKRYQTIRKSLILAAIVFLAAAPAMAATLNWSASSGEVTGYKVYYGTSSSTPSSSVNVGNVTQYSLDKLPLKEMTQYYLSVSAYNSTGESARCTPVVYTPSDATPPAPPTGLKAP